MFLLNFNNPFLNLEFFILFLFKHFITVSIKSMGDIPALIDHYSGKLMNDKIVSLEDYKIKMALE